MSVSQHPGFWGGGSVRDGRVRRLNAATFAELVSRYINIHVAFPLTRKEFWQLEPKERDSKKDGAFLTGCGFSYESEGRRSDENSTSLTAVILDLDSGDFLQEMAEHPSTISDALFPFNHAVWHTAKSRPGIADRLKIMVEVAPCHPSNLKRLLGLIVYRLGIPKDFSGSRESAVVSQAHYRPICFSGETPSAVIASKTDGIAVHISDLPELDPEEDEMLLGRTYACDSSEADDEFHGLTHLPVTGLKLEDIREALDAIDPDCSRPMWLQVGAALRHQFSSSEEEAQEAFEAFAEWSARGVKYAGRKDVWNLWRSLRAYCKGRTPVTIRTIFKYGMDAGWENTKVAKKLSLSITEWFAECQDKEVLMIEGPRRVAGLPFKNDMVEEALITSLRKRLMALNETIDKATIKKEVNRVRRADKQAKRDTADTNTPNWLRPFIYVGTSDTFNHMGSGIALKPGAFDRFYSKEMMPASEETPANGEPVMNPSAFALNVHKILRVDSTIYDPTQNPDEQVFLDSETNRLYLNTYDFQSPPVPDPEFAKNAERLIRKLVDSLIKEPYLRELLLDYLALQCQFPGRKIPWSFLIQSAPGAGKGTLGEIMEAVLGPVNVNIISPSQMDAKFNEWAMGSLFGIFNEVHIPGERRDAVMNAIKPLISDTKISLNLKNRDGDCRARNVTNYIAFTNFKDAAHLAAEDRRWAIIFSALQTRAQVMKLQASGHFEEIRWLITPEGASALRYFFMKRVISENFPLNGHAPETVYRTEVVEQSKNHLQTFIEDTVDDGTSPLVGDRVIHDGALKNMIRNPRDHAFVSRYLSLMGYERYSAKRYMVDSVRGHLWTHTERWTNGVSPVEFLKERMKAVPDLDAEPEFE